MLTPQINDSTPPEIDFNWQVKMLIIVKLKLKIDIFYDKTESDTDRINLA